MPSLIYSDPAIEDLERLADFRAEEDVMGSVEVVTLILDACEVLRQHPLMGRKADLDERELIISHGRSGYIALYRFDKEQDRVTVHAIRHQREAGFND